MNTDSGILPRGGSCRRARQPAAVAEDHKGRPEAEQENRIEHLHDHVRWETAFAAEVVRRAERGGLVGRTDSDLQLTPEGRERARQAIVS